MEGCAVPPERGPRSGRGGWGFLQYGNLDKLVNQIVAIGTIEVLLVFLIVDEYLWAGNCCLHGRYLAD